MIPATSAGRAAFQRTELNAKSLTVGEAFADWGTRTGDLRRVRHSNRELNAKSLTVGEAFADWTGLEPATSAMTGRHSNRLNYQSFSF